MAINFRQTVDNKLDLIYSDIPKESRSEILTNKKTVEDSIDNILILSPYDIPFSPVGADLEQLLFRPMNSETEHLIANFLVDSVQRFDTRIKIINNETEVIANYDFNAYDVNLAYTIKGLPYKYYYERRIYNGDS